MQKKLTLMIMSLTLLVLPLAAQNAIFAGAQGNFIFPAGSSVSDSAVLGFGGGGLLECGYAIGGFEPSVLVGYDLTSSQTGLIKSKNDFLVGAGVAYNLNSNSLKFMPTWIGVRPQLAIFADIFSAEVYRSQKNKERNVLEPINGITPLVFTSISLEVPNVINFAKINLVPYGGYRGEFSFDKSGLIYTNTAFAGARLYFKSTQKSTQKSTSKNEFSELFEFSAEVSTLNVSLNRTNEFFSPDGDGIDDIFEVQIESDNNTRKSVKEWSFLVFDPGKKVFYSQKGSDSLPTTLTWNGVGSKDEKVLSATDYQYVFQVITNDGKKAIIPGIISVDVMVTKEADGRYHIILPSVVFGPDSPGFDGLTSNQLKKNKELFDRVLVISESYKDYNIIIQGHAHNVSGTEKENIKELIPLSKKRAETVLEEFAKRGIDRNRMTAEGKGSSEMLSTGKHDIWKNRRVEFVFTEK